MKIMIMTMILTNMTMMILIMMRTMKGRHLRAAAHNKSPRNSLCCTTIPGLALRRFRLKKIINKKSK